MTERAELEKKESGWTPKSDGWFILHASKAPWVRSERFGIVCDFEGDVPFPHIGINIHVLQPGKPACLYHREDGQEDFFILSGECILLIEEEEHRLNAGHFVHCPPGTTHVFVGAGEVPCAILMIGHRPPEKGLYYPVNKLAAKYGASVETDTTNPREAYGKSPVFGEECEPVWPLY
jgi:uncharacterized cupin superfamily protein